VCHEFVIGEIALGLDVKHHDVLDNLMDLRTLSPSSLEYYLLFLSLHQIVGRKIGCVDTHLLISCITHGVKLWTLDKHLSSVAHELHIGYQPESE
jgi:predicted nucleic acid-binding protein